ncbi:MAG: flippase-like domain-containing protein [Gemmatimonadetes bacterium]|nr:flippase-like domain-containing protein [Gemmatimonadota bacterium]
MRSRRIWRRILTFILIAAAGGFLFHAASANWADLRGFEWQVRGGVLALSLVAHVGVLAFGVFLWSRVLSHFTGPASGFPTLLRIWSLSNAARYIPGGVWQFLTAAQLSRDAGLSGVLALTSMMVHVLLSLIAAVTVSALVLPMDLPGLGVIGSLPVRAAVIVMAVLIVHPRLINGALGLVPRLLRRDVLVWRGSWGDGIGLLVLANASWLLYGVAYTLFVASLAPVGVNALLPFTAVNALSFTAGYLAVPVPGGVGVRESAMTLLLAPYLPAGVAAIVSIAARLWSIAAELLLVTLGILFRPREPGPPASVEDGGQIAL